MLPVVGENSANGNFYLDSQDVIDTSMDGEEVEVKVR